ncbi:MAG TPA: hypothetical protein PK748_03325 [Acidimicrobiales bacterium]|nr:hypothetical protein [Acidimicrobiales bacterium]HRA33929.1 hypothetical protein [Acidimicrobiales bacterium]
MASERPSRGESGSVLMLMPAAVLIVVMLGAIAVDRAVVFGAQRDLVASAQAAADNGASLGVDLDRLRADGEIEPDLAAIDQAIALAATTFEPGTTVTWYLQGDDVVVELERTVDLVFAPGVPGAAPTEPVRARATAELRLSDP